MDLFTAAGFYPFTIAALVLVGLLAVEIAVLAFGLSLSSVADAGFPDHPDHGDHGLLAGWMAWLNAGGVPMLILIMIWLASFAAGGFVLQGVAQAIIGPLPTPVACLAMLVLAMPATRTMSRWAARVVPRDETTAVSQAEFIGLTGTVTLGPLDQGKPGRVRVRDRHGNIHVLRARAARGHVIPRGALVLVVEGANGLFEAIPAPAELAAGNEPSEGEAG